MSSLSLEQVTTYLDQLKELGKKHCLYDIHTHATEIIFDEIEYEQISNDLLSSSKTAYKEPKLSPLRLVHPPLNSNQETLNKVSKIGFNRAYQHIGPRVYLDQMSLCGVSKAAILPVSRPDTNFQRLWNLHRAFANENSSLLLGYCVPIEVETSDIKAHLENALDTHPIRILKIHPNLTDISIEETKGKERIESMLDACSALKLPALIHGGCSPILHGHDSAYHAKIDYLKLIPWGNYTSPIIIAHLGAYGCKAESLPTEQLSQLAALLQTHDHLYTDTSGLAYPIVQEAIDRIPSSKIVYGSDFSYYPMWHGLVHLLHAYTNKSGEALDKIKQIAHTNPEQIFNP
ncbi:amidohydrolase family protein [Aurantivibrio plasticivorans]